MSHLRLLRAVIGTSLACGMFLIAACERIETALYDRAAARAATPDRDDWLNDGGMHVVLCGTGSPIADPDRANSCTAVLAAGRLFLVDVGPGSWKNVALWRLPRAHLRGVLLTHFHSDHMGDLGEVVTQSWIAGRSEPLPVFGPPGVGDVVGGFRQAYAADVGYRNAHHGHEAMPTSAGAAEAVEFAVATDGSATVIFDADGLTIRAFAVDHDPVKPAVGYRFDYAGRSVAISGDTVASPNLIMHAKDADVIVHEALAGHMIEGVSQALARRGEKRLAGLTADILDYHATPVDAANAAREAGAKMLVLTHMVPPVPNFLVKRIFLQGTAEAWDGPIVVADDGLHLELPAKSDAIHQHQL